MFGFKDTGKMERNGVVGVDLLVPEGFEYSDDGKGSG